MGGVKNCKDNYEKLKERTAKGWNTWSTSSVLSHVLLPEGLSINIGLKDYTTGRVFSESLIGKSGESDEHIHPGIRSYNASYTELNVQIGDIEFMVQSSVTEGEQYVLLSPIKTCYKTPTIFVEAAFLWNKKGYTYLKNDILTGVTENKNIEIFVNGKIVEEMCIFSKNPYIAVSFDEKIVISTGKICSVHQAENIMSKAKQELIDSSFKKYGELSQCYQAMSSCLAWDTIYEPESKQICTPVSRLWNIDWGGYVLFCWDTFFSAIMTSIDNKDLAYCNIFAILNEITENGFVPNFGAASNFKSRDRSQPPVGSLVVWEVYKRYKEKWLIEECFEKLSAWNKWFFENRTHTDKTFCWGSIYYKPVSGRYLEREFIHNNAGASLESGLDNSPMYDDVPFDYTTNLMQLSDVGLTSLFVNDCDCLVNIAKELGKDYAEIQNRGDIVNQALQGLWSEEHGLFLNRRTDSKEFSTRISPTNFYALFSNKVSKQQADRCVKEHFYNENEFWGEYIIPSISRNDPAYKDQSYWRGRIWAPTNFLTYLAFRKSGEKEACKDLAVKSKELLLKEWFLHGHIHENYCGDTGMGCGVVNSDKFYSWGGLLGYIALIEEFEI